MKIVPTPILILSITSIIYSQGNDALLSATVKRILPPVIDLRHIIHQHPELSNREFNTSKLVAEHLKSLGLEVRTGIAHTGVVGVLKSRQRGKVVALRADMDALPVTEQTGYSFKSTETTSYNGKNTGVMHACGHDIHTSVMLGVAGVLASMKEKLLGTIIFIFQPAEEGVPTGEEGGARLILKEGLFQELYPDIILDYIQIRFWKLVRLDIHLGPPMLPAAILSSASWGNRHMRHHRNFLLIG